MLAVLLFLGIWFTKTQINILILAPSLPGGLGLRPAFENSREREFEWTNQNARTRFFEKMRPLPVSNT